MIGLHQNSSNSLKIVDIVVYISSKYIRSKCNICMEVEFDKRKAIHHQGIIQLQFSQCCEQCLIENIQRKSQIDFS